MWEDASRLIKLRGAACKGEEAISILVMIRCSRALSREKNGRKGKGGNGKEDDGK